MGYQALPDTRSAAPEIERRYLPARNHMVIVPPGRVFTNLSHGGVARPWPDIPG